MYDLVLGMNMRHVCSIYRFGISIMQICKYWNHPAQQIPSEKKYCRDTSSVKVIYDIVVVVHDTLHTKFEIDGTKKKAIRKYVDDTRYLIKHPFQTNRRSALIFGSATKPI